MRFHSFRDAVFLHGVTGSGQLPPDQGREVAFAGRSNTGKSSVINALTGQKRLARVSRTPGRTRELNFFQVGPGARIVDLPGYGYARVSREQGRNWARILPAYLARRRSLAGVVVVMDIRHPFRELDLIFLRQLERARIPFHIVLNKADALTGNRMPDALRGLDSARVTSATVQTFSSVDGTGVSELRAVVLRWLEGGEAKKTAPVHRGR
jgi:GTP-binding protein